MDQDKSHQAYDQFIGAVKKSITNEAPFKLILSEPTIKQAEIKGVNILPKILKERYTIQFVYKTKTQHLTKNVPPLESLAIIEEVLTTKFRQGIFDTQDFSWHLRQYASGKKSLSKKKSQNKMLDSMQHDREKQHIIPTDLPLLQDLNITSSNGQIKKDKKSKFRQINRYVQIISDFINLKKIKSGFSIVDMGAGKAYLSFGLYHYLNKMLNLNIDFVGVEARQDLVEASNLLAHKHNLGRLTFKQGYIGETQLNQVDMLIALHACNTATDDAIYQGVQHNAQYIICSPCCHKQVRNILATTPSNKDFIKDGIMKERFAEMLTDIIRTKILEAFGYKTKIIEFISTEHTPKNLLILADKKSAGNAPNQKVLAEIKRYMDNFGVRKHHLLDLINS